MKILGIEIVIHKKDERPNYRNMSVNIDHSRDSDDDRITMPG